MHPALAALPAHEQPLPGETASDYWLRIREQPRTPRGPRLLSVDTMSRAQREQYQARCKAGMHCWDALTAVAELVEAGHL